MMMAQRKALPYKPELAQRQIDHVVQRNKWVLQDAVGKASDNVSRNRNAINTYLNDTNNVNILWVVRLIEPFIDLKMFVSEINDIPTKAAHDIAIKALDGQSVSKRREDSKDYFLSPKEKRFFCLEYAAAKIEKNICKSAVVAETVEGASVTDIMVENTGIMRGMRAQVSKNIAENSTTLMDYLSKHEEADMQTVMDLMLPIFSIDDFLFKHTEITERMTRELAAKAASYLTAPDYRKDEFEFTPDERRYFLKKAAEVVQGISDKYKNGSSQML